MSPEEFMQRWNELKASEPSFARDKNFALRTAQAEAFEGKALPEATKEFLTQAGLPWSSAPYASFDVIETLPRVWEVFSPGHWMWTDEEKRPLLSYVMIGSNEDGNPICMDESQNGQIVVLEHEDGFRPYQFVNSSIAQLAVYLLVFHGPTPHEHLPDLFTAIDERAMAENTFWTQALRDPSVEFARGYHRDRR